ncbi:MAG: hypothetical protein AABX33_07270 [Nanoarchaeota archaeon]
MSVSLVSSQTLHLAQKVLLNSAILNKPITAIDRAIEAVIEDPEIVNRVSQPPQVEAGAAYALGIIAVSLKD